METQAYIVGLIGGVLLFAVVDFLWLTILAQSIYQKNLGYLLAKKPVLPAAVLFYVLFVFGLIYLVIDPFHNAAPEIILLRGAVYGLMCYMTYDLSNWAVIKNWPAKMVIIDIAWGVFLSTLVTGGILVLLTWFDLLNMVST